MGLWDSSCRQSFVRIPAMVSIHDIRVGALLSIFGDCCHWVRETLGWQEGEKSISVARTTYEMADGSDKRT
jgi:hypothetical protein